MKLITNKAALVECLGIVNKAVSSRSSIQVLSGVLVDARDEGIVLSATMSVADNTMPSSRASTSTPDSTWMELREETALFTIPRHSTSAALLVMSFIDAPRSPGWGRDYYY